MKRALLIATAAIFLTAIGFYFGSAFRSDNGTPASDLTSTPTVPDLPDPKQISSGFAETSKVFRKLLETIDQLEDLEKDSKAGVIQFKNELIQLVPKDMQANMKASLVGNTYASVTGNAKDWVQEKINEQEPLVFSRAITKRVETKIAEFGSLDTLEKDYNEKLTAYQESVANLLKLPSSALPQTSPPVTVALFHDLTNVYPKLLRNEKTPLELLEDEKKRAIEILEKNKENLVPEPKWWENKTTRNPDAPEPWEKLQAQVKEKNDKLRKQHRKNIDEKYKLELKKIEDATNEKKKKLKADLREITPNSSADAAEDKRILEGALESIMPPGWKAELLEIPAAGEKAAHWVIQVSGS